MKKETLKLEHVAPYLPYGLKMQCIYSGKIDTVTSIVDIYYEDDVKIKIGHSDSEHIWMLKPILRPLSDLTKEIEFDGENIIPLIELYRNSFEYYNSKDLDYEFIDSWGAKGNILKVYQNRNKDEYTEFVYSNLSFRKDSKCSEGSYCFGMSLPHPIRVVAKYTTYTFYNNYF